MGIVKLNINLLRASSNFQCKKGESNTQNLNLLISFLVYINKRKQKKWENNYIWTSQNDDIPSMDRYGKDGFLLKYINCDHPLHHV